MHSLFRLQVASHHPSASAQTLVCVELLSAAVLLRVMTSRWRLASVQQTHTDTDREQSSSLGHAPTNVTGTLSTCIVPMVLQITQLILRSDDFHFSFLISLPHSRGVKSSPQIPTKLSQKSKSKLSQQRTSGPHEKQHNGVALKNRAKIERKSALTHSLSHFSRQCQWASMRRTHAVSKVPHKSPQS